MDEDDGHAGLATAVLRAALVEPFDFPTSCMALVTALKVLCQVSGVTDETAIARFAEVFPRISIEVNRADVNAWLAERKRQ